MDDAITFTLSAPMSGTANTREKIATLEVVCHDGFEKLLG